MAWEIKPARDAFPSFAAEWDRLNREIYRGHPMFDSRFIGPLLECFAKGDEQLCIHRSTTEADGALILCPAGLGRWTLFLPAQAQAGAVLLRDGRLMETLLATLPGFVWSVELLALDPQYSPDWTHLRIPRTVQPHALTMAVEITDGDFDGYWRARPKSLMKNMRRYQGRVEEQFGTLLLVTIGEPQEMKAAVTRYGALEMAGWKGQAGTAISIDNAQGRFYEKVLRDFAATGQGKVLELHVGGKLAASRLIILHERMWIVLKVGYDESLAAIAPGWQLLHEALKQAFLELRPGSVEFYTNATRNQADWATSLRHIQHHQLYRGQLSAAAHGLGQTLRTSISGRMATNDANDGEGGEAAQKFDPISVKRYASAQECTPDTVRLFDECSRKNIEFSLGWFDNLQRTVFANDPGVRYYVKELAGMPIAALPLRLARDGPIRRIEALGNYYTSLYAPILAPAGIVPDLRPILEAAIHDHHGARVISLTPMNPDSPTYEALLTGLRSSGWIPFRYFCFGNWYLKVDKPWGEYLREREGKLRSTIKRMGKKFAAKGGTLEIVTDPVQIEPAIRAFNDIYAASWKKPEPYPDFIPGLIRVLAEQRALRLGIARLAGRPIAAQIWIVHRGKASIFKLAYDESFAPFSPGTLLTAHLMERVIEQDQVTEVDYLIGDDEHKKSWMSHRRERWGIVAYNPRTFTGLALLVQEIIGRTIRNAIQMTQSRLTMPAQTIHWEIIPIRSFGEHAARWDALQRLCANVPFLESAFLLPLLEEFGTGHEVLALGSEQGKLCAAAILTRTRVGIWQTFQPSNLPLGPWLSFSGTDIADLGKSLIRALPGINISLSITQIDPMFQQRPADASCIKTLDYISTAWVDIDQGFDAYWEGRGKNLKTNSRKQRAKLQAEGTELSLECISKPEFLAAAMQDYGALESAGWKAQEGTAVHPNNAQGRFYRKMLENFCAAGSGRIYRYRFNDKTVAMDLCIESGDRIVILKTAYDESYKTVSPSTLMRQEEFSLLFADPNLKRIEFYGKVMEWHTRWTEKSRTIYHVTIYRWAFLAQLHAIRKHRRAAALSAHSTVEPTQPNASVLPESRGEA